MSDTLPRAIADLCGILMGEPRRTHIAEAPVKAKAIELVEDDAGEWRVLYFGKLAGNISKTRLAGRDVDQYRALSVHNDLKHFYSVKSAQDWLLSNYH